MKQLIITSTFLLWIIACQEAPETTVVKRENITESVYASGILKSKNQYDVYATVSGLLNTIYVEEGDTVNKGALLFTISNEKTTLSRQNAQLAAELADIKTNQGRLDELSLAIAFAKSKLFNDSLLYQRQQNLWDQNIGSKVALENAKLNYENARTTYNTALLRYNDEKRRLEIVSRQAQKNLEIMRRTENDFTISSGIEGKIYSLLMEEGEMVNPQTPLAVIGDAESFVLELQVDEFDIVLIKPGQQVKVTMDSYRGKAFDAVITKVYPLLNERTKTAKVEAQFKNPPPALYPNLTLEANIILQIRENVLTVPRPYIIDDRFVLSESGDTVSILTGAKDYIKAEVIEGLDEGDVLKFPR